jgi:hypothetical protein
LAKEKLAVISPQIGRLAMKSLKNLAAVAGLVLAAMFSMASSASAQLSSIDKIVNSALNGPEIKKAKLSKHEFNIKKVKISDYVDGVIKIEGQLSHHLSFRDDDQFYYTFEKRDGKITKAEFKIDRGGLAPYAGKLAKELPVVGLLQEEIESFTRRLGRKLDGSWEDEAESIAYQIALRVDPESKKDLVVMLRKGIKVQTVKSTTAGTVVTRRPMNLGTQQNATGNITGSTPVVRDLRKKN